jgi:hypothetical protein
MDTVRSAPTQAGSNKLLWGGVAVVVILVLLMGAALIRIQAQPEAPRLVVLPALEAAPANAALPVASASADAATEPHMETSRPRIVHLRASEPAVARAPQRDASRPGAVESETPPGVKR